MGVTGLLSLPYTGIDVGTKHQNAYVRDLLNKQSEHMEVLMDMVHNIRSAKEDLEHCTAMTTCPERMLSFIKSLLSSRDSTVDISTPAKKLAELISTLEQINN